MLKKTLICFFVLGLSSSVFAAGQETFTTIPKTSTGNYITTIREAVNANFSKQHTMNTELYAADLLKANASCFESEAAFNACFTLDWPTGGSMTWPASDGNYYAAYNGAWANISDVFLQAGDITTVSADVESMLGAANDAAIRTAIGLAIGTDVQAYDADLADLADGSLTASKVGNGLYVADDCSGVSTPATGAICFEY